MVAKKVPKKRNRRSDSAAAAVAATANALAEELQPPKLAKLPPDARPFWPTVIAMRPRDRWLELDLINAVELCRMLADIERLRAVLADEGDFVRGKPHPAHKLLQEAGRRAVALSRVLHLHPEATEGRARDAGNTLRQERHARTAMTADDDLIPGLLQ